MNIQVTTITTPLVITTSLGRYFAKNSAREDGQRWATPAASLDQGVYALLAVTDFEMVPHIVEQRDTTIRVQVGEPYTDAELMADAAARG